MENTIILDLATTLSITTGISLVDDFHQVIDAMEKLLSTKQNTLGTTGLLIMRPRVANYILENYPQLEGLQVDVKEIDTWLHFQKQTFGNEFTFLPINVKKNKVKTR